MEISLYWSHFFLDKILKLIAVLGPQTIEARRANDLLFKSFKQVGALFASDENIYKFDFRQAIEYFFQQNLPEKASGSGN